jgi:hypothetical protein
MSEHLFPHLAPSHGGYVRGCRCDGCHDAKTAYNREWARLRRAGLPTKRFPTNPKGVAE